MVTTKTYGGRGSYETVKDLMVLMLKIPTSHQFHDPLSCMSPSSCKK